jgi:predicted O-methyltransferase YrrM
MRMLATWLFIASMAAGCEQNAKPVSVPASSSAPQPAERVLSSMTQIRLPGGRLADDHPSTPREVHYAKDYQFSEDWFTHNLLVWEKATASLKGKPNLRYLEVGAFEGRSVLWMLENVFTDPTCRLTAIDLFAGDFKDRYYKNLRKSGHESRVTTITGYSQVELRKLPLEGFDAIYIDGSHRADDVLEDAVLSWRLLKKGGVLIFDDYQWTGHNRIELPKDTPKPAVNVFYMFYGKHFDVVHNGYQLILRRKPA